MNEHLVHVNYNDSVYDEKTIHQKNLDHLAKKCINLLTGFPLQ